MTWGNTPTKTDAAGMREKKSLLHLLFYLPFIFSRIYTKFVFFLCVPQSNQLLPYADDEKAEYESILYNKSELNRDSK